jgi:hypothetical protein
MSAYDLRRHLIPANPAKPPTSGDPVAVGVLPYPASEIVTTPRLTPVCVTIGELLALNIPPRAPLLAPWLTEQSLSMIYAWRGIGKSWLALSIAYAVASGCDVLGWHAPAKRRVLYLDGELPARVLQSRLALIVKAFDGEPEPDGFRILTPDLQLRGLMPNLSEHGGQEAIDEYANDVDLIVVDNISTLARSGKENEGESWLPIQEWALRHRAQGRAILFVHHAGKGGQQRGASRREDVLDTVISLRRPPEYSPADGARFELHFEKSRNMTGDDAQPLDVHLHGDDNGGIRWEYAPAEAGVLDRLEALVRDGASRAEIQEELGMSRFALARLADKANASGRTIRLPDSRKRGAA